MGRSTPASEPVFIEPIQQRDDADCAIACLAMLTGHPYCDVIAASPPRAHKKGMFVGQILTAAKTLGYPLRNRRKFNLQEDFGILRVGPDPDDDRYYHAVLLLEGKVYDAMRGRLWLDVDIFLREERYRPISLLTPA